MFPGFGNRATRTARARQPPGASLKKRGGLRQQIYSVQLRYVGVYGVHKRDVRASTKQRQRDVAEQVSHDDTANFSAQWLFPDWSVP